jgi:hypothetical protein
MQASDASERNTIVGSVWLKKQEKEHLLRFIGISIYDTLANKKYTPGVHYLSRFLGPRVSTCVAKT